MCLLIFAPFFAAAQTVNWVYTQDDVQRIGSADALRDGALQATLRCHAGGGSAQGYVAEAASPGLVTLMVLPDYLADPAAETALLVDGAPFLQTTFETAQPEGVPALRLRWDSPVFAAMRQGNRISLDQVGRRTEIGLNGSGQAIGRLLAYCQSAPDFGRRVVPGFDCARAQTPTEQAICADIDLTLLDRSLNQAMQAAIGRLGADAARADQRAWLASRDTCGASKSCLVGVMNARIPVLAGQTSLTGSVTAPAPAQIPRKSPYALNSETTPPAQPEVAPPRVAPSNVTTRPSTSRPAPTPAKATTVPEPKPVSELGREMMIAHEAWLKIPGYDTTSQPDRLSIRDFQPQVLSDGSALIEGLGLRVREVQRPSSRGSVKLLEIVDVRDLSPAAQYLERALDLDIGGHFGGTLFSLDQALRTALSRNGEKRLREGFSFRMTKAVPFKNHKNEPSWQVTSFLMSVRPKVRAYGLWRVAEAGAGATDPVAEIKRIVADFDARLAENPCGIDNRTMMAIENEIDLFRPRAEGLAASLNLRQQRDTVCEISKHGAYALPDLERLAGLRIGMCEDFEGGQVSDRIRTRASELQREVAPERYFDFARIGIYDIQDPKRMGLDPADGRARISCLLDFLEDALFASE